MAEEQQKSLKEKEDDIEVEQDEIMETGNESAMSTSNDIDRDRSEVTRPDLREIVSEGTEIHPDDIIAIEELPQELNGRNSDETLKSTILYEFPADFENENLSHPPQVYFDYADNLFSHEVAEVSELQKIHPFPQAHAEQKDEKAPCVEKPFNKMPEIDTGKAAGTKQEVKLEEEKAPIFEMNYKRSVEIKKPITPTIDLLLQNNSINAFKLQDYSSDELADVEDNDKDSSASDNNDCTSATRNIKPQPLKGLFHNAPPNKRQKTEILDESQKFIPTRSDNNDAVVKNLPSASMKNKESSSSSPSHIDLKSKIISNANSSNDNTKTFKLSMTTINEAPDQENVDESLVNAQPSHSKANPLKMKAKVINRKDKCNVCNVRLGLCAIRCRCGGYYCAKHRYDNEHNCTFDYKSMGADEIRKNNPKIIAEKVRKL